MKAPSTVKQALLSVDRKLKSLKEEAKEEAEEELKKQKLSEMFYGKNWVEKLKGCIRIITA